MNYYISDLHLFHEKAIGFDHRPFANIEEMHDVILANWNGRVTNGDTVYILGDIAMRGKNEDLTAYVSRLKGHKVLIKGNHDDLKDYRYRQMFEAVFDYREIRETVCGATFHVILSHYPILSWNRMIYGSILLYGHVHNGVEEKFFQKCLSEMTRNECRHALKMQPTAYNVGCMMDAIGYTPRTLEEIFEKEGFQCDI